jgi:hypothetical protein
MPTTIPTTVAWAKFRITAPIYAATNQSPLMEPSLIRLTPLTNCTAYLSPHDGAVDSIPSSPQARERRPHVLGLLHIVEI